MHTALHWLAPAFDWLALGLVLLATLAVGICVHELLHLVPLHLADTTYTVTLLPENATAASGTAWTALESALSSGFVRVDVTGVPSSTPGWVVRVAALLPLVLALPLALVAVGVLPDPVAADDRLAVVALVAVTGCGLPSPADWAAALHGASLRRERGN